MKGVWAAAELQAMDMSTPKSYKVRFQTHPQGVYLRPTKPYYDGLFEQIFGFRCRCADYDFDRTVSLEGVQVISPAPAPASAERAPSSAPPSP